MREIKVHEYTVIEDFKNGVFEAKRNDVPWKSLIGDNFTLALVDEIESNREKLSINREDLEQVQKLRDDIKFALKFYEPEDLPHKPIRMTITEEDYLALNNLLNKVTGANPKGEEEVDIYGDDVEE